MVITPQDYEKQLEALLRATGRAKAKHVNSAQEISRIRAVIATWFETLSPMLRSQGLPPDGLAVVDAQLQACMQLTLSRSPRKSYLTALRTACKEFKRQVLLPISTKATVSGLDAQADDVAAKLAAVLPSLAESYRQVHADLRGQRRLSYRGTAAELREILRELLERLAPDDQVSVQPWFKPEVRKVERTDLTQQQRVKYILEKRNAGSKVEALATGWLTIIEDGVPKLVRDMYSRASVAAHTDQDIREVERLLDYFDALVRDLCE